MSRLTMVAVAALLMLCADSAFAQAPAKPDTIRKKATAAITAGAPSRDMPNCASAQCASKLAVKSATGTASTTNVGKGATKDSKSKTEKRSAIKGGVKPKQSDSTTKKP